MRRTLLMASNPTILREFRWSENRSENPFACWLLFRIWTRIPYQQSLPEECTRIRSQDRRTRRKTVV